MTSEARAVFIRLFSRAVMLGERTRRITRLRRHLEWLGASDRAIDSAYERGYAGFHCRRLAGLRHRDD